LRATAPMTLNFRAEIGSRRWEDRAWSRREA
jgi:hypothetical protein